MSVYPFTDYFKGFEKLETVRRILEEKTGRCSATFELSSAAEGATWGVDDEDGHLMISAKYLDNGDIVDIYLDIIQELIPVNQFM